VPSGNCHTGILMIAEKAADLIKCAHGLQNTSAGGHSNAVVEASVRAGR
jgi:hypothetical protein